MTLIRYQNRDSSLSGREQRGLAIILAIIGGLTAFDIWEDWLDGATLSHIIPEAFIVLFTAGVAVYLLRKVLNDRRQIIDSTREAITAAKESARNWQSKAETLSKGITDAISEQFDEWGLSPAEQEVSFLLLKGLSIQEIAAVRETSERTVRQQASDAYRKSGLSGRVQLSAFFLEDLFDRPQ